MTNRYADFAELRRHEQEGRDYAVLHRSGVSGILVMAPHGGGIEPGTGDIADAVAGSRHAYYCFKGIKPKGNRILHITSNRFDEPLAEVMLWDARWVLTIHGCREEDPVVWIGGRDTATGDEIGARLRQIGIPAGRSERPGLRGLHPDNICNRGRSAAGVQLELSVGLRRSMFTDLGTRAIRMRTTRFHQFVEAVQSAVERSGKGFQ